MMTLFDSAGQVLSRDLSRYENGGTLSEDHEDGRRAIERTKARLRAFLWRHWNRHTRGMVVVKGSTTEGAPWEESYFIEPDERGDWRIAVDSKGVDFDLSTGVSEDRSSHYEAYTVSRIEVSKNDDESRRIIPRDERRLPKTYRLMLKDRNGTSKKEL